MERQTKEITPAQLMDWHKTGLCMGIFLTIAWLSEHLDEYISDPETQARLYKALAEFMEEKRK